MGAITVVERVHGSEHAPRALQPGAPDSAGRSEQRRFPAPTRGFQCDAMPSDVETVRQTHIELHDAVHEARGTHVALVSQDAVRAAVVLDDDLERIVPRRVRQPHGQHGRCTVPRNRDGFDEPLGALALELLPGCTRVLRSLQRDAEHLHRGEQGLVGACARFPVLVAPAHLDPELPGERAQVAPSAHAHAGSSMGRGFEVGASNRRRPAMGIPIQSGR